MSGSTTIRESRQKAALRLAAAGAFVVLPILLLLHGPIISGRGQDALIASYAGAVIFGVLGLRFGWALVSPGTLIISAEGVQQDLGWRHEKWLWADIKDVRLLGTAANVCMIYRASEPPVRIFGWEMKAVDIFRIIESHRSAARPN